MNKISCIVFLAICSVSCASSTQIDFEKISWLVGHWNRTNVKASRTAHERWEKVSETELQGWGVLIQGEDTVFIEKLRIVSKDESLFYVADVAENVAPVYFKLIALTENGFTCENMQHDFPKKIQYILKGDSLKAITSGDGKELFFEFVKSH